MATLMQYIYNKIKGGLYGKDYFSVIYSDTFRYTNASEEFVRAVVINNDKEVIDQLMNTCMSEGIVETLKARFYREFFTFCIEEKRYRLLCRYFPYMDKRYINFYVLVQYLRRDRYNTKSYDLVKKLYIYIPSEIMEESELFIAIKI
jgi:hypothetical protein